MVSVPRLDYRYCKQCGGDRETVGLLSRHRLCATCATARVAENNAQIAAGEGPFAERRLRRSIMRMQRDLLAAARGHPEASTPALERDTG